MKWNFWGRSTAKKLERVNQKRILLQREYDKEMAELRDKIAIDVYQEEKDRCYEMWKPLAHSMIESFWGNKRLQNQQKIFSPEVNARIEVYSDVLKLMGIWETNGMDAAE